MMSEEPEKLLERIKRLEMDVQAYKDEAMAASVEAGDLREQVAKESEATPAIAEAIKDRHETNCGPKYGQPLHSCPDVICRDAVAALGVLRD